MQDTGILSLKLVDRESKLSKDINKFFILFHIAIAPFCFDGYILIDIND